MGREEIIATLKKEIKVVMRERRLLAILLIQPIILISVFGYAFSGEIKNVPLAVIDDDSTEISRELILNIQSREVFNINYYVSTRSEAIDLIKKGDVLAAIYIPKGFGKSFRMGEGSIEIFVDESNFNVAMTTLNYVTNTAYFMSKETNGGFDVIQRYVFTTKSRMIDFIAPAIVGVIVQILGLILSASSISREKEEGTLELLLATPIKGSDLIIGKFLGITAIIVIDIFNVMLIAHYAFDVEVRGSIILLFATQLLFLTGSIGLGLAISSLSNTQLQGIQVSMIVAIVSIFLSGFFYPLESMPEAARVVAYFIPLTYANIAFRNIMVKGNGLETVYPYIGILVVYTILTIILATYLLRSEKGGLST